MSLLLLLGRRNKVPSIVSHPSSVEVYETEDAVFSVLASGSNLSYQWEISSDDGINWTELSGETDSTYTLSDTVKASHDEDQFRCVVTNDLGTITSNAATLRVWNPLNISTGIMWFDAQSSVYAERTGSLATTEVTANDASVGTWPDRSGNLFYATSEADGERPALKTNALNGLRTIKFSGSQIMTIIDSPFLKNKPGATAVFACRASTLSVSGSTRFFQAQNNANLTRFDLGETSSGNAFLTQYRRGDGDSATSFAPVQTRTTDFIILSCSVDWENGGSGALGIWRNGESLGGASVSGTGNCADTNSTRICIGGIRNSGGIVNSLVGDIAEGIIVPSYIDSENVRKCEEYLSAKYNIALEEVVFSI